MARLLPVRFAPSAHRDLDSIARHVSLDSPVRAGHFVEVMFAGIMSLSQFPDRHPVARESPLRGRIVRRMVIGNYRVLYSVMRTRVDIIRVKHGSME